MEVTVSICGSWVLWNIDCGRRWYPLSPEYVSKMYTSLVQVTMWTHASPLVLLPDRVNPIAMPNPFMWKNIVASGTSLFAGLDGLDDVVSFRTWLAHVDLFYVGPLS